MEGSVSTMIEIVVAILLVCIILMAVINMSSVGGQVIEQVNNAAETREVLKEYRKYNAYDGTVVRGSDVIALILKTMGSEEMGVRVSGAAAGNGDYNMRLVSGLPQSTGDLTAAKYEVGNLQLNIGPLIKYHADLEVDSNSVVRVISFERCDCRLPGGVCSRE